MAAWRLQSPRGTVQNERRTRRPTQSCPSETKRNIHARQPRPRLSLWKKEKIFENLNPLLARKPSSIRLARRWRQKTTKILLKELLLVWRKRTFSHFRDGVPVKPGALLVLQLERARLGEAVLCDVDRRAAERVL